MNQQQRTSLARKTTISRSRRMKAIPGGRTEKPAFADCLEVLSEPYRLYLGYLELDFEEAEALRLAGLEEDMKFRLAYYAWKQAGAAV
ncbi:hypothetical protein [Compostibacter hankyongensis]|uniref:Uncharacterized protein n=1 Tax=Compostibacter hankyongensis TaxID=1007089 RepID=A0ABP8GAI8_9BACT